MKGRDLGFWGGDAGVRRAVEKTKEEETLTGRSLQNTHSAGHARGQLIKPFRAWWGGKEREYENDNHGGEERLESLKSREKKTAVINKKRER